MDVFVRVVSYVGFYLLGRTSYVYWRNKYLEDKKQELLAYHAQLLAIEQSLEEKDKAIRNKWQKMVDDISKYQAAIDPEDRGKWSEWDDVYFQSWNSAEK